MNRKSEVEKYVTYHRNMVISNPSCGTSHYNFAVTLIKAKKYDEAEKEFLEAIECSPGLVEAYVQIGGLHMRKGELEKCIDWNLRAIKVRPGFSESWGNIGFVKLQLGKIDEAIEALEKAVKLNCRFVQALTTLANAYLIKGKIIKSIDVNKKVLRISPNFAVCHNNLCIAYLESGNIRLAKYHVCKAISLGYKVASEIVNELNMSYK